MPAQFLCTVRLIFDSSTALDCVLITLHIWNLLLNRTTIKKVKVGGCYISKGLTCNLNKIILCFYSECNKLCTNCIKFNNLHLSVYPFQPVWPVAFLCGECMFSCLVDGWTTTQQLCEFCYKSTWLKGKKTHMTSFMLTRLIKEATYYKNEDSEPWIMQS